MFCRRSCMNGCRITPARVGSPKTEASGLQLNSRIEKVVVEHISGHPAAKITMQSLVGTLAHTFVMAHGEIKGWAEIVQSPSRPHESNRKGSGVFSACVDLMACVGWNAALTRATADPATTTANKASW
ncbi:type III effector [Pseudomonas syringae pv. tomato]|uniref:Type III effector n=7 Tax=Pseudomonas syringae group TaxID=136849 RepID=A0AAW4DV40_PSESX|nr:type III effector HopT2 [Pseudomonas syringae pv. tomato str. DC3000]AVI86601.1 type III effector [Pseudomonas syringae pv. tomato]EEB62141.1 type III effector HopT2 [Pseudomonas syringae pv. tomato T1]KPW51074.1 Type III effector HopT1-1 [Pseudomonas syringae pv. antirrhini]KPW55151.1 Type III effector HopT1-1 [Pseudomonas syringae pv. berberidis]KPY62031.1 Type III effector HopT1-1 [Pseudomonas syringae pv. spinaceae]MBI6697296.1 type III effector [Pseudomonas syringae]MBM0212540.1 type